MSCFTSSADIDHAGHFPFTFLQVVKTPFLIVVSFSLFNMYLPKNLGSFSLLPKLSLLKLKLKSDPMITIDSKFIKALLISS